MPELVRGNLTSTLIGYVWMPELVRGNLPLMLVQSV